MSIVAYHYSGGCGHGSGGSYGRHETSKRKFPPCEHFGKLNYHHKYFWCRDRKLACVTSVTFGRTFPLRITYLKSVKISQEEYIEIYCHKDTIAYGMSTNTRMTNTSTFLAFQGSSWIYYGACTHIIGTK